MWFRRRLGRYPAYHGLCGPSFHNAQGYVSSTLAAGRPGALWYQLAGLASGAEKGSLLFLMWNRP